MSDKAEVTIITYLYYVCRSCTFARYELKWQRGVTVQSTTLPPAIVVKLDILPWHSWLRLKIGLAGNLTSLKFFMITTITVSRRQYNYLLAYGKYTSANVSVQGTVINFQMTQITKWLSAIWHPLYEDGEVEHINGVWPSYQLVVKVMINHIISMLMFFKNQ